MVEPHARGPPLGDYWLTTLTAIRRGEPDWRAIAAYEGPVRRFVGARFPSLPTDARDDLVQEILVAMREKVVAAYDPSAGRFRSFLRTVIRNAVHDAARKRRPQAGLDPERPAAEEPSEAELDALDLEAEVVHAVQEVHDRYARGKQRDLTAIYVLSGVLVRGESYKQIAAREGLGVDQVKRVLQRLRGEILETVFTRLLPADGGPRRAQACAELARECLRAPRREARLLAAAPDAELVAAFTAQLRAARRTFAGAVDDPAALDLVRGIEAIFAG